MTKQALPAKERVVHTKPLKIKQYPLLDQIQSGGSLVDNIVDEHLRRKGTKKKVTKKVRKLVTVQRRITLAEAIRIGGKKYKQSFFDLNRCIQVKGKLINTYCGLGMAGKVIGLTEGDCDWTEGGIVSMFNVPQIRPTCPHKGCEVILDKEAFIPHLNDNHNWSASKMADAFEKAFGKECYSIEPVKIKEYQIVEIEQEVEHA